MGGNILLKRKLEPIRLYYSIFQYFGFSLTRQSTHFHKDIEANKSVKATEIHQKKSEHESDSDIFVRILHRNSKCADSDSVMLGDAWSTRS